MTAKYKITGYFFAIVFLAGAIMSAVLAILEGKPAIEALLHPFVLVSIAIALLMFLSAHIAVLIWFQPLVWFGACLLSVFTMAPGFWSAGFFMIAALLLFRFGFYKNHKIAKLVVTLAVFYATEIIAAFLAKEQYTNNIANVFIMTILLVTLYLAYQEKLMVYLKEPKETLSLKGKGLTDAEQKYVLAMVGGKSPKEIAFFYEVSESTVRNTLARAYKKLGVGDRSELAALAARVELVA